MKIKTYSSSEKRTACFSALRYILDNTKLSNRQQRIFEILSTYNVDITGSHIEKLLNNAGFKTK